MRLVHVVNPSGGVLPGVQIADGSVVPMTAMLGEGAPSSVADALAEWEKLATQVEDRLGEIVDDTESALASGNILPANKVQLRAPVGHRNLVVCAGGNYKSHTSEMGVDTPSILTSFIKSPSAVIGSGEPIVIPPAFPDMVDFEGELCVVFARTCHGVAPEEALTYIGGFTILNDVSARDAVSRFLNPTDARQAQWDLIEMTMGKQLPTFAPIGPGVTTVDEIADPTDLRLTTKVNGKIMQDATTADLVVDIANAIAQLSRYYVFRPGDVLSTGTPAGVGFAQSPPVFLTAGDVVTVEVDSVGVLRNEVVLGAPGS
jgi:2-keto-4-pentenoate hydratase/2-oxohepta-3-ene-1,7-dioic acid hydratase in catechol pathway